MRPKGLILASLVVSGACHFGYRIIGVVPMPELDPRRELLGTWRVRFLVDSMTPALGPGEGSGRRVAIGVVEGSLSIRDTLLLISNAGRRSDRVAGAIHVDFAPVVHRLGGCFDADTTWLQVTKVHPPSRSFDLDVQTGDTTCALIAIVTPDGDSLVGGWAERLVRAGRVGGSITLARLP